MRAVSLALASMLLLPSFALCYAPIWSSQPAPRVAATPRALHCHPSTAPVTATNITACAHLCCMLSPSLPAKQPYRLTTPAIAEHVISTDAAAIFVNLQQPGEGKSLAPTPVLDRKEDLRI